MNSLEKMSRIKEYSITIMVFIMIYVNSSYNVAIFDGVYIIGISLVAALFILFSQKRIIVNRNLILVLLIMIVSIFVTSIITKDTMKDAAIMISAIFVSAIFIFSIEFKQYCKIYNKLMFSIASFSLVVYVIAMFYPDLIRLFPSTYFRQNFEVYNLGLTFINLKSNLIRNMGIFWEPGAYQTYLVFALLIEIFNDQKTNRFAFSVFMISLITTWSTTGLINCLLIILIYIIHRNSEHKFKYFRITVGLFFLSIFFIIVYSVLPYELQYAAVGKITNYLSSQSNNQISAHVRFTSTLFPLRAFMRSPVVGVGYVGLTESVLPAGHTMITNTPVNWFASYGVLFGTLSFLGISKFAKKLVNNFGFNTYLLVLIAIILSITTEQYLRNVSMLIFVMYGFVKNTNCKLDQSSKLNKRR